MAHGIGHKKGDTTMALTPVQVYALAKKYTDDEIAGGGAIKGKNCVIDNITPIEGGNRVTFKWTLDNGTEMTDYIDVMDGTDGSTVTIVTSQADGDKIAEIIIDDVTTNLYAPKTQYSTMPTPASIFLDKVIQYVGTTTENYSCGHFYKCVDNGTNLVWDEIVFNGEVEMLTQAQVTALLAILN